METFNCNMCLYSSNSKFHYNRHLKTNKHLNNMIKYGNEQEKMEALEKKNSKEHNQKKKELKKNIKEQKKNTKKEFFGSFEGRIICDYCNKDFKTRHIMLRHQRKYCKVKKEESIYKIIVEDQKEIINGLLQKVGNNTTINANIQNNSNNTNNTNVQLNTFGKEDRSMLTDKFKKKLIKGPFTMIPRALKMIYFNKKYPGNKTIKLINRKENILKVHNKNGWEYVPKDEVIDQIIDNTNYEIDNYYENSEEQFSEFVEKTYQRFQELYNSQDTSLWNRIKKDVDFLLWNNM